MKILTPLQLVILLISGIVLVIMRVDFLWSSSIDLASHYALSFRIFENWTLVQSEDAALGGMLQYPKISHTIAAIVGLVFNSAITGFQLVSLISLMLIWVAIIYILSAMSLRASYFSLFAFVIIILANRNYIGANAHGDEIVGNFFFAQLVGQAVVLCSVAFALFLEIKRYGKYAVTLFLAAMVVITTDIYLLSAIELLGVLFGVVIFHIYHIGRLRHNLLECFWHAGVVVVALVYILTSPQFGLMREISINDGSLPLALISSVFHLSLLCGLVLGLSAAMIFVWKKNIGKAEYFSYQYFGLYAGAISSLCLIQIFLFYMGFGSEYATKKYVFGLITCVFVLMSMLSGEIFSKRLSVIDEHFLLVPVVRTVSVTLSLLIVFYCSMPGIDKSVADISDVADLERQLISLRDVAPPPSEEAVNIVMDVSGASAMTNYMLSIGVAKTPYAVAIAALRSNELGDFAKLNMIFTSSDSLLFRSACKMPVSFGKIVAVDAGCLGLVQRRSNWCRGVIDLTSNGSIDRLSIKGFSHPEIQGTWTTSKRSIIYCFSESPPPSMARIKASAFLHRVHSSQRLIVRIGSTTREFIFNRPGVEEEIDIPLVGIKTGSEVAIELETPDAVSPLQLGISVDGRQLGVNIRSVSFE